MWEGHQVIIVWHSVWWKWQGFAFIKDKGQIMMSNGNFGWIMLSTDSSRLMDIEMADLKLQCLVQFSTLPSGQLNTGLCLMSHGKPTINWGVKESKTKNSPNSWWLLDTITCRLDTLWVSWLSSYSSGEMKLCCQVAQNQVLLSTGANKGR